VFEQEEHSLQIIWGIHLFEFSFPRSDGGGGVAALDANEFVEIERGASRPDSLESGGLKRLAVA